MHAMSLKGYADQQKKERRFCCKAAEHEQEKSSLSMLAMMTDINGLIPAEVLPIMSGRSPCHYASPDCVIVCDFMGCCLAALLLLA